MFVAIVTLNVDKVLLFKHIGLLYNMSPVCFANRALVKIQITIYSNLNGGGSIV